MNDICLVVDGIEYPAHRLILCASSDVFQVNINKYNIESLSFELVQKCIMFHLTLLYIDNLINNINYILGDVNEPPVE